MGIVPFFDDNVGNQKMRRREQGKRCLANTDMRPERLLNLLQHQTFQVLRIQKPGKNQEQARKNKEAETSPNQHFFGRYSHLLAPLRQGSSPLGSEKNARNLIGISTHGLTEILHEEKKATMAVNDQKTHY